MPRAGLTLSLDYGKIELDTFTQNGTGGVVPEGQFGFDRTANTGGVTVPSVLPSGSVAPSPQPATYFMLIDGVNGGSTDAAAQGLVRDHRLRPRSCDACACRRLAKRISRR